MAIVDKNELFERIKAVVPDDESGISILEDVTDTFISGGAAQDAEALKQEYEGKLRDKETAWAKKFKERFSGEFKDELKDEPSEDEGGTKEETYESLFKEKEEEEK